MSPYSRFIILTLFSLPIFPSVLSCFPPYILLSQSSCITHLVKQSKRAVNETWKQPPFSQFFFTLSVLILWNLLTRLSVRMTIRWNCAHTGTAYLHAVDMPGEVGCGIGFPWRAVRRDNITNRVGWQDAFDHWVFWWESWKANKIMS